MPIVAIVYGLLLTLLGLGSYYGSGMVSATALIPAFFGVPAIVCGILARNEKFLRHAMHAAAMLGLLGFAGSAPGLFKVSTLLDGTAERPDAIRAQAIMAVLSLIFVALCVKSFIDVRKAKKQALNKVSGPL